MDGNFNVLEAVAIACGKFLAVGNSADILGLADPNTKKIGLKDKTVITGIIDTHQHPEAAGELKFVVNFENAETVADALIKEFASKTRPGEWIRGIGSYALSQLKEKRWLTRYEIDSVAPDNPVYLMQTGHDVMCNSYALRLAKIAKDTPDPPGGMVERDPKTGEPNGVLHEAGIFLGLRAIRGLNQISLMDSMKTYPPFSSGQSERKGRYAREKRERNHTREEGLLCR